MKARPKQLLVLGKLILKVRRRDVFLIPGYAFFSFRAVLIPIFPISGGFIASNSQPCAETV